VRVPAWLAVPVATAVFLTLIAAGLGLSCLQAMDDKEAGSLANALLGGPTLPPRPPYRPGASEPPTSWWMTSPRRLFLEALSESRLPASAERDAVVASRLDAARAIAPLDPPTRLARAGLAGGPTLGLTSDIISARATGRLLLKQGKIEPALVVYQRAFQLLDTARPEDASWPVFDDAANVRRFHLPLEDQAAEMLTDILDAEGVELTELQLNALMPPDPVLRLAAARVLGDRGRPEADAMRLWARDNPLPDPDARPTERALALAARAEALALDDHLEEAAASYQEAVDLVPTKRLQRCWALNLAELEARLDHRESRDQAWELARGADPRDPVNLRLAEARQRHAGASLTAIASDRPVSSTRDDQLLRTAGP
jgi:tetratricopeptide (TPR) repeat protein